MRLLPALCLLLLLGTSVPGPAPAQLASRDGGSIDQAVIIADPGGSAASVAREAEWLRRAYPGWQKVRQALIGRDGRRYDQVTIESPTGETRAIYFDITDAFGPPR